MTLLIPLPELVDDRTAAEWCRQLDRARAEAGEDQQDDNEAVQ